ncbi:MAG: hypothetical protein ACR2P3_14305 [Geminicoccaceae bacterium]
MNERDDARHTGVPGHFVGSVAIGLEFVGGLKIMGGSKLIASLMLIGGLSACQTGSPSSADGNPDLSRYPSLHSVPSTSRPSSPIEERRQIVRDLIEERDRSRQRTAVIRHRSGLRVEPPPASTGDDIRAEDVIPDAPEGDDAFRLAPDDQAGTDSAYRGGAQFEDGGLDDFIRELKQNTRPEAPLDTPTPTPIPTDEPAITLPDEDDVSFVFPETHRFTGSKAALERRVLLAAFAPVIAQSPASQRDGMIRLAASDDEPGIICRLGGWAFAWAGVCLDDAETPADGEEGVGADLEQAPDDAGSDDSAGSEAPPSDEAGRQRAERRLSEEDAAEAIEDAGRSALAPVTSSLDKLRDFIRARRSSDAASSSPERTPSLRAVEPAATADAVGTLDRPPIPNGRPDLREAITIVDAGETFSFARTPTPAFKPSREEPGLVILPPESRRQSKPATSVRRGPPPRPQTRPNDLLSGGQSLDRQSITQRAESDAGEGAMLSTQQQPGKPIVAEASQNETSLVLTTETPATPALDAGERSASLAASDAAASALEDAKAPSSTAFRAETGKSEPGAGLGFDPFLIEFGPEAALMPDAVLPADVTLRLAALLADAKAYDQKIHIIGEASTNHLAKRRATEVGAVLVQLGATAEILEYDHDARPDVDQVRLLVKPTLIQD